LEGRFGMTFLARLLLPVWLAPAAVCFVLALVPTRLEPQTPAPKVVLLLLGTLLGVLAFGRFALEWWGRPGDADAITRAIHAALHPGDRVGPRDRAASPATCSPSRPGPCGAPRARSRRRCTGPARRSRGSASGASCSVSPACSCTACSGRSCSGSIGAPGCSSDSAAVRWWLCSRWRISSES